MASISGGLVDLSQKLVLHQQEVWAPLMLLPQLRKRKWKQRTNLRSLMMIWALVFLIKPL
uniref:Uncharacterized protein n=1 Tax=Panthera leo TaxID=9689 RepID=A0A8C8X6W2_PANLE